MKKILLSFLFLITSCDDNNSFYIKEQCVISCINKGIYNLYITSETNDISFDINWVDSLHNAPSILNLKNIQKGYKITKYNKWKFKVISNQDFKLLAAEKYKIKRSQGDVVSQEIEITTNDKGEISNSININCE